MLTDEQLAELEAMPALTRKRVNDRPVTWHVHYADVRVGMIVIKLSVRMRVTSTADFRPTPCRGR
jgi:hypothetical protein